MKKTAHHQPAGETATNQHPTPINEDRQSSVYQKRSWIDKAVLVVVGVLALVVIALSFSNTAKLAELLTLNPYLAACLVEMLFGSLLFIRGRQRALKRNVPIFLQVGYFTSLAFVTLVNMWGLGQISPLGFIVGGAITGAMWLMESTLVWLWTESERPHEKSLKEIKREAEKERKKIKLLQEIEWMRYETQKPDLTLIKKARKMDQKRMEVVKVGLPEFFLADAPAEIVQEDVQTDGGDVQTVHEDLETDGKTVDAPAVVQENVQTVGDDAQSDGGTVQKPDAVVTEPTEDRLEIDGNSQSVQTVYETANTPAVSEQENVQTDGDDVQSDVHNVQTNVQPVYETTDTPAARLYNYHKEKGKLPGRVRLARMCGMEVKDARRALDRMERMYREREIGEKENAV